MSDSIELKESMPSEVVISPYSLEAEEAVVGSILINPQTYLDVATFLSKRDFHVRRLAIIWQVFDQLMERNLPIDVLTVREELEQMGLLEDVGGFEYLSKLSHHIPTSFYVDSYAHVVEQMAIRRRMLDAANQIAKSAYNQEIAVDTMLDEAAKVVFGVSEGRTKDVVPIAQVVDRYDRYITGLIDRAEDINGVPTGFRDLDNLLLGLQKSDLLIIAGRPSQGKTGFLLSVAKNAAQTYHKHVAIFSLEMSNEQLVQRLIGMETAIDSQHLRTGRFQNNELDRFLQACVDLRKMRLFLDDTPAITPLQLRTKCRRLHLEFRLDLIVVDYLQLMGSGRRTDNRVQEVSEISRNLKILARELDVPVLAAAQLSRAVEQRSDKRPQLSDLRESGSLEQDADVVRFIYRPDLSNQEDAKPNVAEIIVAKHRNGPTDSVELIFRPGLAKFESAMVRNINLDQL